MGLNFTNLLAAAKTALATVETVTPEFLSLIDEARALANEAGQLVIQVENELHEHVGRISATTGSPIALKPLTLTQSSEPTLKVVDAAPVSEDARIRVSCDQDDRTIEELRAANHPGGYFSTPPTPIPNAPAPDPANDVAKQTT